MNTYILEKEITVFYVTATSFPDGIGRAYNTLIQKVPNGANRELVGFSCPNPQGVIIYNAAMVQEFDGEAAKYGLAVYTIPIGEYLCETIANWRDKEATVQHTFMKLVRHPNAVCPCVEMYKGTDMVCMVKIGEVP